MFSTLSSHREGRTSRICDKCLPSRRARVYVALYVAAILSATLAPWQFLPADGKPFDWELDFAGKVTDWVGNVLLFLPLGFSLAWMAHGDGARGWRTGGPSSAGPYWQARESSDSDCRRRSSSCSSSCLRAIPACATSSPTEPARWRGRGAFSPTRGRITTAFYALLCAPAALLLARVVGGQRAMRSASRVPGQR